MSPDLTTDGTADVPVLPARLPASVVETCDSLPARSADGGDDGQPVPPGYELLGVAGKGGMGVVLKARNVALNRVEALKVIRAGELAGPRALARFRFEAEAAAGLDHPHIVPVYGVGDAGGGPYLAMRWVDGASLADRAGEFAANPRAAAAALAKVARAVHYAHRRGILHRDLKPANVLVDARGEPFVTDFGVARRLDATEHVTQAGLVVGTPAYMSPEQARGDANLTVAADVYSLGATLYEVLAGRLPFTGTTVLAVLKQVTDARPVGPRAFNPALDDALEAVVLHCLEKDPADRYPSAEALADDLDRYARGEPVSVRPPGFWDWFWQMLRTEPERHPHYSWEVTGWFGVIQLATHGAVWGLAAAGRSCLEVWAAFAAASVWMAVVLWWYMARKFRELPETERHSMVIAVGHIVAYLPALLAFVPLSGSVPAAAARAVYPLLAVISGLGVFVLGSTNWSRFFTLGLGLMALAPVLAAWPEPAPLAYGGAVAAVMWYWTYSKKVTFGGPAA